jgi:hypothetical protein
MYIPALLASRKDESRFRIREMVSFWDRRAFVRAPWHFYRDDPYWVPPLLSERSELLDPRRNPFLRPLESTLFCAEATRGFSLDEVVGTIAVWFDARKRDASGEAVGYFGLFESINNVEVASALLGQAEEWLRERQPGTEVIRGPASLNPAYGAGILVDGFNARSALMMPYSAPCYPEMIEAAEFYASAETVALRLDLSGPDAGCAPAGNDCAQQAEALAARLKATIQPLDTLSARGDSQRVKELWDLTWAAATDIAPLTDEEFAELVRGFIRNHDPRLSVAIERGEDLVALGMGLPDVSSAMRWGNGRLFPVGWLAHQVQRRRTSRLQIFRPLVQPDESPEIGQLLCLALVGRAAAHGYRSVEFAPIAADDQPLISQLALLGARVAKRYRVYEKRFTPDW